MMNPRSYFARMNENRNDNWLTDDQLLRGTEEFFNLNGYSNTEYNKTFDQGSRSFISPIVASRIVNSEDEEVNQTILSIFKSKIKQYELSFFGFIESIVYDVKDNYDLTSAMLVTDSLSYFNIIKKEEVGVAIENMMREGLFILFVNHRFAYALFDKYESMTKPIPVSD
ncbi:MAG TPA: hypothetical protein VE619_10485 [Nitrososphaeraceae archaeon]|nr:hypothetical protein [Nitrososphaeraceae archaeon]